MSTVWGRRKTATSLAAAAALALAVAGCGSSSPPKSASASAKGNEAEKQCSDLAASQAKVTASDAGKDTFVFAASADPTSLNPFYDSDGESFRVTRQIYEGLVGVKPCSADPAPSLATEFNAEPDGKTFHFTLQQGVTFTDGTAFDAKAACANFDWMNNQPPGPAQSADTSYYWLTLMHGFGSDSIYDSCTEEGSDKITITLKQPYAGFLAALSLPSFAMQSPTALAKYNNIGAGDDPTTSPYSLKHPTGTGPYMLKSWERGNQVQLVANPNYWDKDNAPLTPNVTIKLIEDPTARATALLNGDIDGFDLVAPSDMAKLDDAGMSIVNRPAFNILYLGMNQAVKPLDNIKVRQAIAYALDKQAIADNSLPEGTQPALEFMPDSVNGYTPDVTQYSYDPDKAKALLKEAGAEGMTLEFNYPTDVSRPYMPSPVDTYNVIASQLQAVGIKVKPVADSWTDYLDKIQGTKDHGIHLLGWTGDYNDPDNFLGVFFGQKTDEWGFDNPKLFKDLTSARGLPTVEEQTPVYQKINQEIMDYLPGVPLASPVPSLAFGTNVEGFVPSPVQDEPWNRVVVTG
jgi:peptide/nickel transport system substrate-binding protein